MRETMLILHFIGLAMGIGTGFAHAFLGAATTNLSQEETTRFLMRTLVLSRMGHIGLTLLLISGFYLITPYWSTLTSTPLLMVKLGLVLALMILIALIGVYTSKAKKGEPEIYLNKIKAVGKFTLPIALAIVILAVSVFK